MDVQVLPQASATVVAVRGDIDGLSAEAFTQALGELVSSDRVRLVADLSGVPYVSSAGLRSLLITLRASRAKAGDLRLAEVRPAVKGVLTIAGFDRLFRMFDGVAEACASYET